MASTSSAALPARLSSSLNRAHRLNPRLNAFTQLSSQSGLEAQYASATAKGKAKLDGTTVAVKDMFATTGDASHTTCASRMLRDYQSPFEATVVRQLRREGALVMGKTNMDEFGMGSANFHSYFGPTLNPAGPRGIEGTLESAESEQRLSGGSSGGSAAAIAAGLCDIALATDTGGSTRLPAAYCGVVGFKPSYGLLSRFGVVAYASSLDTVGLMSTEVKQVQDVFEILDQYDPQDPTSIPAFARTRASSTYSELWYRIGEQATSKDKPLAGIKIGVPADLFPTALIDPSLLPTIRSTLARLKELGATLHSVRLKTAPHGLSAYYVLASAEASSNLARYDGTEYGFRAPEESPEDVRTPLYAKTRTLGFGNEVKKRLLLGTFALSAEAFDSYYLQAQRVRKMIQLELDSLFSSPNPLRPAPSAPSAISSRGSTVDFLVHPTTICPAPLLSSFKSPSPSPSPSTSPTTSTNGVNAASSSYVQDVLSLPASLAGLPAISIPIGRAQGGDGDGWPVGMTLAGQWGNDRNVLQVARILQSRLAAADPEQ